MADLCHQCAFDTFGKDTGDLARLSTPDDTAARRYAFAPYEGCDPVHVDHAGRRVDEPDAAPARPSPTSAPARAVS